MKIISVLILMLSLVGGLNAQSLCKAHNICGAIEFHGINGSSNARGEDIVNGDVSYTARFALFQIEEIMRRNKRKYNYNVLWAKSGVDAAKSFIHSNVNYIIINQSWAEVVLLKYNSSMPLIYALAHEVAHHINGDTKTINLTGKLKTKAELNADYFAGYMLGKLHSYKWDAVRWLDNEKNKEVFKDYPTYDSRIQQVILGYNEGCKKGRSFEVGCDAMLIKGDLKNPPDKHHAKANESQNLAGSVRAFVSTVQKEEADKVKDQKLLGEVLRKAGVRAMKELKDRGVFP